MRLTWAATLCAAAATAAAQPPGLNQAGQVNEFEKLNAVSQSECAQVAGNKIVAKPGHVLLEYTAGRWNTNEATCIFKAQFSGQKLDEPLKFGDMPRLKKIEYAAFYAACTEVQFTGKMEKLEFIGPDAFSMSNQACIGGTLMTPQKLVFHPATPLKELLVISTRAFENSFVDSAVPVDRGKGTRIIIRDAPKLKVVGHLAFRNAAAISPTAQGGQCAQATGTSCVEFEFSGDFPSLEAIQSMAFYHENEVQTSKGARATVQFPYGLPKLITFNAGYVSAIEKKTFGSHIDPRPLFWEDFPALVESYTDELGWKVEKPGYTTGQCSFESGESLSNDCDTASSSAIKCAASASPDDDHDVVAFNGDNADAATCIPRSGFDRANHDQPIDISGAGAEANLRFVEKEAFIYRLHPLKFVGNFEKLRRVGLYAFTALGDTCSDTFDPSKSLVHFKGAPKLTHIDAGAFFVIGLCGAQLTFEGNYDMLGVIQEYAFARELGGFQVQSVHPVVDFSLGLPQLRRVTGPASQVFHRLTDPEKFAYPDCFPNLAEDYTNAEPPFTWKSQNGVPCPYNHERAKARMKGNLPSCAGSPHRCFSLCLGANGQPTTFSNGLQASFPYADPNTFFGEDMVADTASMHVLLEYDHAAQKWNTEEATCIFAAQFIEMETSTPLVFGDMPQLRVIETLAFANIKTDVAFTGNYDNLRQISHFAFVSDGPTFRSFTDGVRKKVYASPQLVFAPTSLKNLRSIAFRAFNRKLDGFGQENAHAMARGSRVVFGDAPELFEVDISAFEGITAKPDGCAEDMPKCIEFTFVGDYPKLQNIGPRAFYQPVAAHAKMKTGDEYWHTIGFPYGLPELRRMDSPYCGGDDSVCGETFKNMDPRPLYWELFHKDFAEYTEIVHAAGAAPVNLWTVKPLETNAASSQCTAEDAAATNGDTVHASGKRGEQGYTPVKWDGTNNEVATCIAHSQFAAEAGAFAVETGMPKLRFIEYNAFDGSQAAITFKGDFKALEYIGQNAFGFNAAGSEIVLEDLLRLRVIQPAAFFGGTDEGAKITIRGEFPELGRIGAEAFSVKPTNTPVIRFEKGLPQLREMDTHYSAFISEDVPKNNIFQNVIDPRIAACYPKLRKTYTQQDPDVTMVQNDRTACGTHQRLETPHTAGANGGEEETVTDQQAAIIALAGVAAVVAAAVGCGACRRRKEDRGRQKSYEMLMLS